MIGREVGAQPRLVPNERREEAHQNRAPRAPSVVVHDAAENAVRGVAEHTLDPLVEQDGVGRSHEVWREALEGRATMNVESSNHPPHVLVPARRVVEVAAQHVADAPVPAEHDCDHARSCRRTSGHRGARAFPRTVGVELVERLAAHLEHVGVLGEEGFELRVVPEQRWEGGEG